MLVKVKLIGRYKDITGKQELKLEILNGNTIWHVVDVFIKQYPIHTLKGGHFFAMVKQNP